MNRSCKVPSGLIWLEKTGGIGLVEATSRHEVVAAGHCFRPDCLALNGHLPRPRTFAAPDYGTFSRDRGSHFVCLAHNEERRFTKKQPVVRGAEDPNLTARGKAQVTSKALFAGDDIQITTQESMAMDRRSRRVFGRMGRGLCRLNSETDYTRAGRSEPQVV